MKGRVRLYTEIGYDFGEPAWEKEIPRLRLSDASGGNRDVRRKIVGETLTDSSGRLVRDYDHDLCWAFRMEIVVTSQTILDAGWIEVTGVVVDFTDYGDIDDLEECERCEVAHPIRERYTSRIKRSDLKKTWAVVTILEDQ